MVRTSRILKQFVLRSELTCSTGHSWLRERITFENLLGSSLWVKYGWIYSLRDTHFILFCYSFYNRKHYLVGKIFFGLIPIQIIIWIIFCIIRLHEIDTSLSYYINYPEVIDKSWMFIFQILTLIGKITVKIENNQIYFSLVLKRPNS